MILPLFLVADNRGVKAAAEMSWGSFKQKLVQQYGFLGFQPNLNAPVPSVHDSVSQAERNLKSVSALHRPRISGGVSLRKVFAVKAYCSSKEANHPRTTNAS